MAKNPKFNVKLPSEAVRPLYAAAGVTDLAVEIARGYVTEAQVKVTDAQKKASQRVSSVDLEPKALQTKAVSLMNARVDELSKEAKARQERVEKAYAELQGQAKALVLHQNGHDQRAPRVAATETHRVVDVRARGVGLLEHPNGVVEVREHQRVVDLGG